MSGFSHKDASGKSANGQSYWRGENANLEGLSYQEPSFGPAPLESRKDPYYQTAPSDAREQPYYGVQAQDDIDFLTRQTQATRAVYSKDHVAAALLAFFLGLFGVHKFYLGYNQSGFIMLAVTVIGGIVSLGLATAVVEVIAIIEGVIYLTKSQSEFDQLYVVNKRDWF